MNNQQTFRIGIFGPSLCGKTTLAKVLSKEYHKTHKMATLVLDPNNDADWGPHAKVFVDETQFWDVCWKSEHCLVIAEEAAETINRNKELISVFTRLRHKHHILMVIGHSGTNLLPVMRQQIDTLYLFRQGEKASKVWAEDAMEPRLLASSSLNQFEFIFYKRFQDPRKQRLTLREKK